jgi:hypothetical protein
MVDQDDVAQARGVVPGGREPHALARDEDGTHAVAGYGQARLLERVEKAFEQDFPCHGPGGRDLGHCPNLRRRTALPSGGTA